MERLRVAVGWVVVCAWVASLIVDALVKTYDPPTTLHIVMMIVAGYLFAPTIVGRGKP